MSLNTQVLMYIYTCYNYVIIIIIENFMKLFYFIHYYQYLTYYIMLIKIKY